MRKTVVTLRQVWYLRLSIYVHQATLYFFFKFLSFNSHFFLVDSEFTSLTPFESKKYNQDSKRWITLVLRPILCIIPVLKKGECLRFLFPKILAHYSLLVVPKFVWFKDSLFLNKKCFFLESTGLVTLNMQWRLFVGAAPDARHIDGVEGELPIAYERKRRRR